MATTIHQEELIFYDAMDLPREQRRSFITQKCGKDTASAQRIMELLALHESDGILDEQASDLVGVDPINLPEAGSRVGNYELLEEIGNGGMGLVFRARQTEPVDREVAIKVIKLGMDTRSVIGRFEAEKQTLALMDHPFITQVFDAGATDTGRPYFVMELVRGEAINKYCDEKRLTIRERVKLFIKSCRAIQHAHQKGIIHRDIKPTNILVAEHEGESIPKVIDFGIAKAIDAHQAELTMLTHMGQMLGTPMYMSPEQADLDNHVIDTRSDVYSLGCVLYELVTGDAPFGEYREKGIESIRKAIQELEPMAASLRISGDGTEVLAKLRSTEAKTLKRSVQGELDWILRKVLSRDPGERYESTSDLIRELEAYLNGDAVSAVAPTLSYRISKFVRKNWVLVVGGTFTALVLMSATIVAIWFAVSAEVVKHELKKTVAELSSKNQDLELAEADLKDQKVKLENQRKELVEKEKRLNKKEVGLVRAGEAFGRLSEESPEFLQEMLRGDDLYLAKSSREAKPSVIEQVADSMELADEWEGFDDGSSGIFSGDGFDLPGSNILAENELAQSTSEPMNEIAPGLELQLQDQDNKNTPNLVLQKFQHKSVESSVSQVATLFRENTLRPIEQVGHSMKWIEGELELLNGEMFIRNQKWTLAEQSLRRARRILEPSMALDSPKRFKIRLLLAEALLEQDQMQSATDEFLSVVSDVECMLEKMPRDIKQLLFRLRFQISS